ncbi:accessory gene regulator ArgB-like protein [Clostridium arbusti]|uniref:accessory gene regulator ArgB-like protein n=1 Tax=Clostridium arbusti TaxID=1137848 RepID=UPI00028A3F9C|nr:accessory gene regulator B family protein [Clostridium arbusti]
MFFIERLSKNIVANIYNTSEMDKDEREIIEYGALILILKLIGVLMVVIFSLIFGVLLEALVFYFTTCTLRKYSGGVHSDSPTRCIAIGTLSAIICPIFINEVYIYSRFSLVIFITLTSLLFCYYTIFKLAPVDSPAKPILSMEFRKELKWKSVLTMSIMSIMSIVLIALYINYKYLILLKLSQCICLALLWQCFTLTTAGHIIMSKVDSILKYIIRE